jgi:hypothetical protein
MNAYINTLSKINKLRRRIEYAKFARNSVNNNNNIQRQIMNNRYRALIREIHPLEEQLFILSANIAPSNINRFKRLKRVIAVQRIAKKTIQKRRQNAARARTVMRRALVVGAHHALTPAQISRFLTPLRRRTVTVPRQPHTTRAVTALTRHLNRK